MKNNNWIVRVVSGIFLILIGIILISNPPYLGMSTTISSGNDNGVFIVGSSTTPIFLISEDEISPNSVGFEIANTCKIIASSTLHEMSSTSKGYEVQCTGTGE